MTKISTTPAPFQITLFLNTQLNCVLTQSHSHHHTSFGGSRNMPKWTEQVHRSGNIFNKNEGLCLLQPSPTVRGLTRYIPHGIPATRDLSLHPKCGRTGARNTGKSILFASVPNIIPFNRVICNQLRSRLQLWTREHRPTTKRTNFWCAIKLACNTGIIPWPSGNTLAFNAEDPGSTPGLGVR